MGAKRIPKQERIQEKVTALEDVGLEMFAMLRRILRNDKTLTMNDIHDLWQQTATCFKKYDVFRIDENGNPKPRDPQWTV
jgi:hypothetical protein